MPRAIPFASLLPLASVALAFAATEPAPAPTFSPAELREDFAIARHALEEGHPGLYRYEPKAALDKVFTDATKRLDRPMDAWQFYRVLAPVISAIHCGHTRIELPDSLTQALNTTRALLPLQIRVLGGRLWVYRDLATDDGHLEGHELLAVNGIPAPQLLAGVLRDIPEDGFSPTLPPQTLRGFRFAGMLERVEGFDGHYSIEAIDGQRLHDEKLDLVGAPVPELQARLAKRHPTDGTTGPNGEFELLDQGRIARLRLRAFSGTADDSGKVALRDFFQRAFATMLERGTRCLVLDLRDNGGGEDALGRILFSYLVDQPFKYYDDLVLNGRGFSFAKYAVHFDSIPASLVTRSADGKYHATGHPNWGLLKPTAPHFAGKVFVLENGASFSTTCECMSHIRAAGRATFIGEESGGAYVGNTSGGDVHVVLPHTHVQLGIPILRYDLAVPPAKPFGRGIMPDVAVTLTIADLLAGRDPELAKALELARAELAQPAR